MHGYYSCNVFCFHGVFGLLTQFISIVDLHHESAFYYADFLCFMFTLFLTKGLRAFWRNNNDNLLLILIITFHIKTHMLHAHELAMIINCNFNKDKYLTSIFVANFIPYNKQKST